MVYVPVRFANLDMFYNFADEYCNGDDDVTTANDGNDDILLV